MKREISVLGGLLVAAVTVMSAIVVSGLVLYLMESVGR